MNHPYFFPYAGYFRLMAYADVLVLFDCVQFPRRGYVHRNQLPNKSGKLEWLSLALKKQDRGVLIKDLQFADDIEQHLKKTLRRFPALFANKENPFVESLYTLNSQSHPCDYICDSLQNINELFKFNCRLLRSSTLLIDDALKGEDRVLAILQKVKATEYVNAPGGRKLYSEAKFNQHGIALKFLEPYPVHEQQYKYSMLHRLLSEDVATLKQEIQEQMLWQK